MLKRASLPYDVPRPFHSGIHLDRWFRGFDLMSDAFEATWLFTRGTESVKITRTAEAGGAFSVEVSGPGPGTASYQCASRAECMRLQEKLDAELMAQGFQLNRTLDRRARPDRRRQPRGPGRRRG